MPSGTCCSCAARCPGRGTASRPSANREARAGMIEAPHYSATGAKKKSVSLPAALFDGTVNEHALHRAVVTFLANQRQGTHDTLTRRWVTGGNQKPWRQKGTGRARQGSIRSPQWRHGGVVFGPQPRSYVSDLNKKERRAAFVAALADRFRNGAVTVLEAENFDLSKTADFATLLFGDVKAAKKAATTLVIHGRDERSAAAMERVSRNLRKVGITNTGALD